MAICTLRNFIAAALLLHPIQAQVKKLNLPTYKIVNKCTSDGRYNLAHYGMTHHYCWDKVYYSPKTAPAWMKDYFNQKQAAAQRASAEWKEQFDNTMAASRVEAAEAQRKHEADTAAFRQRRSSPPLATPVQASGGRAFAGRSGVSSARYGTYSQASARPQMQTLDSSHSGVSASPRPPARQLPLALFSEVTVGASRADLVAKLGNPPGKVTGLVEGEESWTYVAEGGDFVKIKLKNDVVASIALPN